MAKQDFVLAGLEVADAVFNTLDYSLQIESSVSDGETLTPGRIFARVVGEPQTLLAAERVALNLLQHLSGIATLTRKYVEAVAGTGAVVVDTRKTMPGLRMLEKYAVSVGGELFPLTVTDRLTAEPPAFGVALAHAWPSIHDVESVVEVAGAAVAAVGITEGPSYTQLRIGPEGPVVMEVAARLGGGHDAELCRVATGVDLNELAVRFAVAEDVSAREMASHVPSGRGGAAVVFLAPPPGTLVEADGVADAEAVPGVEWVRIYRRPGHVFGPFRRGSDRAGAVLATGGDREEALERGRRAADAVRFRVDADAS